MDALHADNIEIVSPTFMNTRAVGEGKTFIADVPEGAMPSMESGSPDSIAFDKAGRAESVTKLRKKLGEAEARIKTCTDLISDSTSSQATEAAQAEIDALKLRIERLQVLIDKKEEKISNAE